MSNYNMIIPHYSVVLAESLSKIIQDHYDFKHKISMELLTATVNDLYLVKSGNNEYILRIPRSERFFPFSKESYEFEMDLLSFLRRNEFDVSYPIPLKKKKSYLGILNLPEGIRYFSLHTKGSGRPPKKEDKSTLFKIGKKLGAFHNITQPFSSDSKPINWNFHLLIRDAFAKMKKLVKPGVKNEVIQIEKKALEICSDLETKFTKRWPEWGIIHGNFRFEKIEILDNGEPFFSGFEYCGYGWRLFDLVYIINSINFKNYSHPSIQSFLSGYESEMQLSQDQKDKIPEMAKLALFSNLASNAGYYYIVGSEWFDQKVKMDLKLISNIL